MRPEAIQIGALSVNWYGITVAVGFLLGLWTASRRAPATGISSESVLDAGPWLIIGSIVGARLLYVLTFWHQDFAGQPWVNILKVWKGGLVYYGGLIGASLGCIAFARKNRLPLWKFADVLAPSIALGQVFGRLGCLLNGCCYGHPTTLPWAISYPVGHLTHPANGVAQLVHPCQLYEASLSLLLYALLAWVYRQKRFSGQVFALYLIGYGVLRGFVEFFRGDYPASQRFWGGVFTPAHLVSLVALAAGFALFSALSRRPATVRA